MRSFAWLTSLAWIVPFLASVPLVIAANGAAAASTSDFYTVEVSQYIVPCLACHTKAGVAGTGGARFVLVSISVDDQDS